MTAVRPAGPLVGPTGPLDPTSGLGVHRLIWREYYRSVRQARPGPRPARN
jgi:hypothetical protein